MLPANGYRGPRPHRWAGLGTRGTDGLVRLARSVPGTGWRQVLRPRAGQQVKQEVAGAEIGRAGPDAPAGDELNSGGRAGPAVDVQPHRQQRAQRTAGQADLDPTCPGIAIVLGRPAQQAFAEPEFAVPCALPAVKGGHTRLERDVHDPPE
jgi:hypothetical protein